MRIYTHRASERERERKGAGEGVVDALWLLVRAHFQYKKVKRPAGCYISISHCRRCVVTMDTRWRGCAGILARQKTQSTPNLLVQAARF
jgi:hypothetical protein